MLKPYAEVMNTYRPEFAMKGQVVGPFESDAPASDPSAAHGLRAFLSALAWASGCAFACGRVAACLERWKFLLMSSLGLGSC